MPFLFFHQIATFNTYINLYIYITNNCNAIHTKKGGAKSCTHVKKKSYFFCAKKYLRYNKIPGSYLNLVL